MKKKQVKKYKTDNEVHHRWCEDCEGKYKGLRNCPECNGINTGIDEPIIKTPKTNKIPPTTN